MPFTFVVWSFLLKAKYSNMTQTLDGGWLVLLAVFHVSWVNANLRQLWIISTVLGACLLVDPCYLSESG